MFGINLRRVRVSGGHRGTTGVLERVFRQAIVPLRDAVPRFMQRTAASVASIVQRFAGSQRGATPSMTPTGNDAPTTRRDWLRQVLNLVLSIAQFAAAALIFSSQFGDDLFGAPASSQPAIVPADYTFTIWGFIFPASIVYGVYQALPRQRTNHLLRRIGFQTAFAFGCITLWSVATLFDPIRYTVPLFFGALWGLISALYQISQARQLIWPERLLIGVPLGVYAAWCTVGTIANTSTSLVGLGYTDLIVGEQSWAVIMLLLAGLISSLMTTASRGNIAYAAGIIWALVGIVVANVTERPNGVVALTAGAMAVLVGLALVRARITTTAPATAARG